MFKSTEEKCAERFTEGTGGYMVCVDETNRHDATMDICGLVFAGVFIIGFMIFLYKIIKD